MIAIPFWLLYILHYLGPRKLLTWRAYILFCIMPLIAIFALSTNHFLSLMWTGIGLDSQNPYLPLQPAYGIIYWICMVYTAILTFTGSFFIFQNVIRRRHSYSRESTYLLAAAVIPLLTAFVEVTGLLSSLKLPVGLTPWAACFGAIILRLSLPRFRLEQVIPIARDIIFERIGDCILVLDMQNRVIDLNPAAEQLFGCRISDVLGLSIERIWPDQSPPMMLFSNLAKAGEELVVERDGEQRTYDLRISPIADSSGFPNNQVVSLSDITERKRAEAAMRESEDRFKYIFEAANVGKSITLPAGEMYPNKAFCQMLGYSQEELKGITWQELTAPDEVEEIELLLEPMQKGEKDAARFNKKYIHKDGSSIWADVSITIRRNPDGTPRHFITTTIDITERKQLEQAVEKARADFLFAVSHELKTPLHVLGATQEMIESLPEERQLARFRQYGDLWQRNLMRLRFIIENLVDSQRPTGMGFKLEKQRVSLADLALEVIDELEPLAATRSVQLRFQGESLPPLALDRNAIQRLLENLLTNAIKFSHLGGQVEIRLRLQEETVRLDIADSGIGIDPHIKPFLFQPFYRSPEAVKAGVQGTGLGLYVSKSIAEAHGGTISLDSEPGKGATVTVRLPL